MKERPFLKETINLAFFFLTGKWRLSFHISFQTIEITSPTIYEGFHVDRKIVYRHISGHQSKL